MELCKTACKTTKHVADICPRPIQDDISNQLLTATSTTTCQPREHDVSSHVVETSATCHVSNESTRLLTRSNRVDPIFRVDLVDRVGLGSDPV
ncbi:hypothetical protein LIER_20370 [Lithospermum erythrorhizon]|uniref:Uncharacterized protein n=1 Tax=Lithospermum erythrorhizon TaxID=34254 RepID=A0AAV3QQC6_LITER